MCDKMHDKMRQKRQIKTTAECSKMRNIAGIITFQQQFVEKNCFHSFKDRELVLRDVENEIVCMRRSSFPVLYSFCAVLMDLDVR